ncbi:hypothetical protein WA026_002433 [Henosepilachna vigintioctopunctata]|uniref:Uncharacterized protein n=1 Tax=Henosepilachna vigintioctopunctata TaxID=420089 RepID=A0AAW1TRC4_9CUCU
MRRSRIREHLRMKKEEYDHSGNTTETHSSNKKENSVTIRKDMKLMHKSRPVTRNRRSISENEAKPEVKSYERTGSLGEGTRMISKNRDISSSIQKRHNNDSTAKKTNPEDSKQNSSRKKSSTNVPTDTAKKESPRSAEILKNASLEVAQDAELIAKDEKGHYEVSYNPELLASDREDKPNSTSFLSFKKDSEITENNEYNGSTKTNEERQKPHEEKLGEVETELKHGNREDCSNLIEHQDFPPVNESSELEAALTIQKLWRGFQSRKKINDNQQNTLSTSSEDEKTNCASQRLQNCQISEEQTITLEMNMSRILVRKVKKRRRKKYIIAVP